MGTFAWPLLLLLAPQAWRAAPTEAERGQKFLLIGLVDSENPTRANFHFVWAKALREAGNDVRIELAGDATVLMRTAASNSVTPVGWPSFREALAKVVEPKISTTCRPAGSCTYGICDGGKTRVPEEDLVRDRSKTLATSLVATLVALVPNF